MKIDMFKDAKSLPDLAVFWLFAISSSLIKIPVRLLDEQHSDLYPVIKRGLVGGPSIIFHRYHEKDITRIRQLEYGPQSKLCDRILGVDANALYLWCMMQELPCGVPEVYYYHEDGQTKNVSVRSSKVAQGWLAWQTHTSGQHIIHERNGKEIRIGDHGIPVDGFSSATNTTYQFHGCFWHGHNCVKTSSLSVHPYKRKPLEEIYKDTLDKEQYIKDLGYSLIRIWECEWERVVNEDMNIKTFLAKFFKKTYQKKIDADEKTRVKNIQTGKFFGLIECDIEVPEALRSHFAEMPPIFKNTLVGREQLGSYGLRLVERDNRLRQPQRMLIGSMKGQRILLFSELARWYLKHGLRMARICALIEYKRDTPFKAFGDSVSNARREGDTDPTKAILADTNKLIGNSCYGKTIVNKDKHKDVQ
jgi:G:T-mismatch repair DNA endonuclease (very short patch repair protein)